VRLLAISAALLLIAPLFFGIGSAADNETPEEIIGDMVITEDTVMYNRTIILQGNLKIMSGGLKMVNSSIRMRCYADGQFKILVSQGTYLEMYNSSLDHLPRYEKYHIIVEKGASVSMERSSIFHSGYGEGELSGLYVEGFFSIRNSSFLGNYASLWAEGVRGGVIYNSSFKMERQGLFLDSCYETVVENCLFQNHYNETIRLQNGRENLVSGCFINLSSGADGRGIHVVNESGVVISENTIKSMSKEGVFIESNGAYVKDNKIGRCGSSQLSVIYSANCFLLDNILEESYQSMLVKNSSEITIRRIYINDVTVGIRLDGSYNITVQGVHFLNVSSYALLAYDSHLYLIYVFWENTTYAGRFADSVVFSDRHLDSDAYRVYGFSRVYFCNYIHGRVLDTAGKPIVGAEISLSFEDEDLFEGRTGPAGGFRFMAPYMVHTRYGKNYSYCEVRVYGDYHFEENPIRFYSWETNEILFKEADGDIVVVLKTDPVEVNPGDTVNVTVTVLGASGPVDDAQVHILVNGTEMFPPSPVGNGKYVGSFLAPEFNGSLKIEAKAEYNGSAGVGYTTILRTDEKPEDVTPESLAEDNSWEYYGGALLISLSVLIVALLIRKKKKKEPFFRLAPVPEDMLDIKER